MLLKIENIEEIGRFKKLKHQGPQFGRLSLVFARNGYGKSTICSILRSLAEQDVKIIEARRKLGAVAESRVHLHWTGGAQVTFATGAWSACPGEILVFDQEYVRRNLHVADSVTRDNKRSLLPVILGDDGVSLINRISQLDTEQRELAARQTATERAIKAACPSATDVGRFVQAPVPDDIDVQIASAEKQVELARHAMAVQQKPPLTKLEVPSVDELRELARRGLESVSDKATEMVEAHIHAHAMVPNGARWLEYGVKHMSGSDCPFCLQDVQGNATVEAFKGYFSDGFTALASDIDQALERLQSVFGVDGDGLRKTFDHNASDLTFWKSVCELPHIEPLSLPEREAIVDAYRSLIDLLERKRKSPLAVIELIEPDGVLFAISVFAAYELRIARSEVAISTARAEVRTVDLARATELLEKRRALKAKAALPLADDVARWMTDARRRDEVAREKSTDQEALRAYMRDAVVPRQAAINDLLELFGASFRLTDTKASFVGRGPNTDFSIAIGPHVLKAGERLADKPSFTTVLSAGDKFTLALAFFVTQVNEKANLADCAVVFDDPFSSQDMDRQAETTSQIRALAAKACQVIVLSHDPRFLKLIEKNARASASYQMNCDDAGSGSIKSWSADDELKETYVRQSERIREFAGTGTFLPGVTVDSLVKDLRPFLEDFLKARFPGRFAALDMLDGMATIIEQAGPDDHAFKDVTTFREINIYTRDHMHAGASAPNPGELRAKCRRIIKVVGSY